MLWYDTICYNIICYNLICYDIIWYNVFKVQCQCLTSTIILLLGTTLACFAVTGWEKETDVSNCSHRLLCGAFWLHGGWQGCSWHAGTKCTPGCGPKQILDLGKDHDRYRSYRWYFRCVQKLWLQGRLLHDQITSSLQGTHCTSCTLPRFPSSWIPVVPRMRSSRKFKILSGQGFPNFHEFSPKQLKAKRQESEVVSCMCSP